MTVASTYSASASVVVYGSKFDHVSSANLTTVGTVSESSDGDGSYIETTSQPGNRLTASALSRITRTSGGTWVYKVKTTATGVASISGEIDTGTAYLENIVINQSDAGGTVLNGAVGIFIRSASGFQRFGRTPNVSINDGSAHTVAVEWPSGTDTYRIFVDGVEKTITYYTISEPTPSSGAMDFPLTIFERNVRNATYDQGCIAKIYAFARLTASGFDLASLSSDASQLIAAASSGYAPALFTMRSPSGVHFFGAHR